MSQTLGRISMRLYLKAETICSVAAGTVFSPSLDSKLGLSDDFASLTSELCLFSKVEDRENWPLLLMIASPFYSSRLGKMRGIRYYCRLLELLLESLEAMRRILFWVSSMVFFFKAKKAFRAVSADSSLTPISIRVSRKHSAARNIGSLELTGRLSSRFLSMSSSSVF